MKKTIKDNDPMIRKYGVMALGELGDKSAIPDLKELFKSDSTSEVKAEVIISLAKLKAKEMMPEFINSLYDSSKEVADASKKALDMLIDASDCSYLAACIQNEHNEVRNYCIITLTRLKNKDCLPDLFATIKNIQGSTRLQVLGLIDSLDDGKNAFNFISLVEKPSTSRDTELQLWVIKHLSAFKNNQETIDYLSQSIRHENGDIRKETVITLGKIGGNKAFEILRYVSNNDASFSVKNLARDVLEKGGSSK
ncbi:MAG: hypothetical protein A3J83_07705 [Elusimicrobia bacterium RIFOXYA2_FULL_40_6]|nr:MAG: hypothetical protein A3J83_07705 [Elusimicrobia bacterium RIFOXYA2_FULL_40_6]